jgi:hypothetical protein
MFQGYYRMSDRLRVPVTSLAILTGNIKPVNAYMTSCYGTELNFKFGVYHVVSADAEELKRDGRVFAVVILAAKRMLDAGENPGDRGKYSLELLSLTKERGYDASKMRNLQKFIYRILRIGDKNIDPKVREVWKMQLIPIDEAVREIQIRDAKEEGQEEGKIEVARNLLKMGLPVEQIAMGTGLSVEEVSDLPL